MKETFQVINSTLSAKKINDFIQQKYNLSKKTECKLFRAAMNHLYIVTDGDKKFAFRVYTFNWRTKLEINEELKLLIHLNTNSTSVSFPIADNTSNLVQELNAPEGKRFGVLFSYAKGSKVPNFSQEASFIIGKALAKVHKSTENYTLNRINYNSKTLLVESLPRTKQFFQKDSEEITFLETLSDFLKIKFENLKEQNLRNGVVHLDVWFDNMHIDENNEVTFFDFDFCGNSWLCLDISYFLFQLFSTHLNENEYKIKADSFIKGYETEIEITKEERELLPYACLAIMVYYISIQCGRFDYWTNIFLNEHHLKRFVGNLKRWINFNNIEIELKASC